jgi:hypothetical protein
MNISSYKQDVIRQIKNELKYNYETKEVQLSTRFFKGLEPDQTLYFSNIRTATEYIIEYVIREVN